ncbi:glycosyltransferase [Umezawaea sp. Da 62-37]|uniref:glycosyltransferase n=1 Tax=Umezawaea sp. Da 62-37 TaxID=3075927 RepID=UPI0028F6D15C|nr:glycosyltransferase [Umezawaea sp. Da 62-37]WNV84064.1 glycosyltransferase [Umezawaea sp. Da 62-37]
MRVLSSITGSQGHARDMLPLIRAIADAGHDVLVALPPSLAPVYADERVRVEPVLPEMHDSIMAVMKEGAEQRAAEAKRTGLPVAPPPEMTAFDEMLVMAGGPHITPTYRALMALALDFKPNLVVRDSAEIAATLVAERLGLRHICGPSGAGDMVDPVRLVDMLDERRAELDLPPAHDPTALYRFGRFDSVPERYSFAAFDVPYAIRYRQSPIVARDEVLSREIAGLPTDKPLVACAMGTVLVQLRQFFQFGPPQDEDPSKVLLQALAGGLSELDCYAVLATGGLSMDGIEVGDNVHVVERMAQPLLLQCADLFVTHGGYNSIRESMFGGTPMAVLPQFGDQPFHADLLQKMNLGRVIPETTADVVRDTCRQVLSDPAITAEVRRAQREMLALPGVDTVVPHLESLALP